MNQLERGDGTYSCLSFFYLLTYNYERTHQGRNMNGRTPHQAFVEGIPETNYEEEQVA